VGGQRWPMKDNFKFKALKTRSFIIFFTLLLWIGRTVLKKSIEKCFLYEKIISLLHFSNLISSLQDLQFFKYFVVVQPLVYFALLCRYQSCCTV
jgi:hypothetical protein